MLKISTFIVIEAPEEKRLAQEMHWKKQQAKQSKFGERYKFTSFKNSVNFKQNYPQIYHNKTAKTSKKSVENHRGLEKNSTFLLEKQSNYLFLIINQGGQMNSIF